MACGSTARSAEWVAQLPAIVAALNSEVTWLTDKKPVNAIKARAVKQQSSLPLRCRPQLAIASFLGNGSLSVSNW